MLKFMKDVIFGEPVVAITIVSLVFTAWLGALSQIGDPVPLWLAIAAPSSVLLGGFYAKSNTSPDNNHVHAEEEEHADD